MSSRRYALSDFEWSIIEPLLPNKPRGVPRVDDRRVLNGIRDSLHLQTRVAQRNCLSLRPSRLIHPATSSGGIHALFAGAILSLANWRVRAYLTAIPTLS